MASSSVAPSLTHLPSKPPSCNDDIAIDYSREDVEHPGPSWFVKFQSFVSHPLRRTPTKTPPGTAPTLTSPSPEPSSPAVSTQARLLIRTATSWIFTTPSLTPTHVFKVRADVDQLRQEYGLQDEINSAFNAVARDLAKRGRRIFLPYVPHCFKFYPRIQSSEIRDAFKHHHRLPHDCGAYLMEYIRPLHRHHVTYLVKRHLSHHVQERALGGLTEAHTLARVHVGDVRPLSDMWRINLQDRPVYLDHLIAERVDIGAVASAMGAALAIIHWLCHSDAAGVKFLLGGDKRGSVQLWLIDFAHCRPFGGTYRDVVTQLVDAVEGNGHCWPRWINLQAFRDTWAVFRKAYLEMSIFVYEGDGEKDAAASLPLVFINELEKLRGPGAAEY